jgi:CRISPR-associated protein Cmr6
MSTFEQRSLEAWIGWARGEVGGNGDLERGPTRRPAHVGLWLDRCYVEPENKQEGRDGEERESDKPGRRALYQAAIDALRPTEPAVAAYKPLFARWRQWATRQEPGIVRWTRVVEATSRVLLHPATGSTVTDGGLLLHHTYGVPYLPGSALKGIARSRAFGQRNRISGEKRAALFGFERGEGSDDERAEREVAREREDEAGVIDFCDALWIPEPPSKDTGDFSPLAFDLVNPHHSDYYTKPKDRPPPRESDEPVPTLLLTLRPGTRFLLVLEAPDFPGGLGREWLDWVGEKLLLPALDEDGIGARTRAGYGRLRAEPPVGAMPGAARAKGGERRREVATVSYQKGNRELRARLPDGKIAAARGSEADALLAALPEAVIEKLRKGKEAKLTATWEPRGRERGLVGLDEG